MSLWYWFQVVWSTIAIGLIWTILLAIERMSGLGRLKMDQIKKFLTWIAGPLLALLGLVAYLFTKNKSLEQQLNQTEAEKELASTLAKKEEASNNADSKEADYRNLLNKYNSDRTDPPSAA